METDSRTLVESAKADMNPVHDSWPAVMKADARFHSIFKVKFLRFLDTDLLKAGCGVHLDVVKFDNYLCRKYPDYTENMSMNEFLTDKFGADVKNFVEDLI